MRFIASLALSVATVLAPIGAASARVDTTPPVIESIGCFCTTPYQYSTIRFGAIARDDESGIASLTWDFGSGRTSEGPVVGLYLTEAGTSPPP